MSIALRASSITLSRRATFCVYASLGMVGIISTMFALVQSYGLFFWPTHAQRPSGLFYSPIVQGGFLGLVIVAMARIRWYIVIPILTFGLILNQYNRGGWIVAGIGLLATWARQPLIILAVILLGAFYVSLNPGSSDIERFNIWQAGYSNLTWLGHGWGSFSEVWIIREGLGYQPMHAHNDYLEVVFELGFYSIPIFCVLAYALSKTSSLDWPILVAFCAMATYAMPSYIPATAGIGALALASCLRGKDV